MLVRATMRLCNNAVVAALMAGAALWLPAQTRPTTQPAPAPATRQAPPPAAKTAAPAQPAQAPSLTEDRDPVRSPDIAAPVTSSGPIEKKGDNYVIRADVEEVVLNCTVLDGTRIVQDLKAENFQVAEDGVQQKIVSFQHTDLPVSI